MARYKPVKSKSKAPALRQGAPCLVLMISGFILIMLFLYFVLKNANG